MRLRGPRRKPCLLRPSLRFSCTDSGSDGSMESDGFKAVSGVTSERFLNVSASSLAIRAVSVVARQGEHSVKHLSAQDIKKGLRGCIKRRMSRRIALANDVDPSSFFELSYRLGIDSDAADFFDIAPRDGLPVSDNRKRFQYRAGRFGRSRNARTAGAL